MIFDFDQQPTYMQSIAIDDIGNTCLRCTNPEYLDYYLITQTVMGKVSIIKFGPVCPDLKGILEEYSFNYKKVNYKDSVIIKEIQSFINDYKKKINQIKEIAISEAFENIPNADTFYDNWGV